MENALFMPVNLFPSKVMSSSQKCELFTLTDCQKRQTNATSPRSSLNPLIRPTGSSLMERSIKTLIKLLDYLSRARESEQDRERERERERETESERDRQRARQTEKQSERKRAREKE